MNTDVFLCKCKRPESVLRSTCHFLNLNRNFCDDFNKIRRYLICYFDNKGTVKKKEKLNSESLRWLWYGKYFFKKVGGGEESHCVKHRVLNRLWCRPNWLLVFLNVTKKAFKDGRRGHGHPRIPFQLHPCNTFGFGFTLRVIVSQAALHILKSNCFYCIYLLKITLQFLYDLFGWNKSHTLTVSFQPFTHCVVSQQCDSGEIKYFHLIGCEAEGPTRIVCLFCTPLGNE